MRNAVRSLWAEPRVPDPPTRVWRDWALVAVLVPLAVLEVHPARGPGLATCRARPRLRRPCSRCCGGARTLSPWSLSRSVPRRWPMSTRSSVPTDRWCCTPPRTCSCSPIRCFGGGPVVRRRSGWRSSWSRLSASADYTGASMWCSRSASCCSPPRSALRSATGPAPGSARWTRSSSASASSWRASCTTPSLTTSRPSPSGPRPGASLPQSDPDAAVDALEVIEEEASRTLAEMRTMVGALRQGEEPDLAPQRGVADIERLARSAGDRPRVDVELSGDLDDLPPSVEAGDLSPRPGVDHQRGTTRPPRNPHQRLGRRRRPNACA